jgi:hypothetical protein
LANKYISAYLLCLFTGTSSLPKGMDTSYNHLDNLGWKSLFLL